MSGEAKGRMRRAAWLNVGSGALCLGAGVATGSSVATFEGVESIFGDALFHEFNARGNKRGAIGAAAIGSVLLLASEIHSVVSPHPVDGIIVPLAVSTSLGVNVAAYTGLLPHDHEHEDGSDSLRHETASKVHAFGDMVGSIVALGAATLSLKYGAADAIGAPIQLGTRMSFYTMEVGILRGRSGRLSRWLLRNVIARPKEKGHVHYEAHHDHTCDGDDLN